MRSLTSNDLKWPNFLLRSISGCFEVFKPNLSPIYSFIRHYSIPKIVVVSGGPLRVFDLTTRSSVNLRP